MFTPKKEFVVVSDKSPPVEFNNLEFAKKHAQLNMPARLYQSRHVGWIMNNYVADASGAAQANPMLTFAPAKKEEEI